MLILQVRISGKARSCSIDGLHEVCDTHHSTKAPVTMNEGAWQDNVVGTGRSYVKSLIPDWAELRALPDVAFLRRSDLFRPTRLDTVKSAQSLTGAYDFTAEDRSFGALGSKGWHVLFRRKSYLKWPAFSLKCIRTVYSRRDQKVRSGRLHIAVVVRGRDFSQKASIG